MPEGFCGTKKQLFGSNPQHGQKSFVTLYARGLFYLPCRAHMETLEKNCFSEIPATFTLRCKDTNYCQILLQRSFCKFV